jgi:hypothetical protein
MTTWFETLTGVREGSPHDVRENLVVEAELLKCRVTGNLFVCGRLETPSLAELRERVRSSGHRSGKISVREVPAGAGGGACHRTERSVAPAFILETIGGS